jgi:hypothetical protein
LLSYPAVKIAVKNAKLTPITNKKFIDVPPKDHSILQVRKDEGYMYRLPLHS